MRMAGGDRMKLQLSDFGFSGAGGQGIGQAGGMSTLNKTFQTMRANAPQYGDIGTMGIAAEEAKWRGAEQAKADFMDTAIKAKTDVHVTKLQHDAAQDRYDKQKQGATMGMFASIAGAGLSLLSDERCKHDIKELDDALSVLRELKPVTFYYNEEYSSSPERMHYGFIAQDYGKVMPDQTYFDPTIDRMCIDTNELIAVLVRAVQELSTKVTRLEAQNALVTS